jgi:hypothetical protein
LHIAKSCSGSPHPARPTTNPCPPEKVAAIKQAFRHFGLL